jgi:hypothetical protein
MNVDPVNPPNSSDPTDHPIESAGLSSESELDATLSASLDEFSAPASDTTVEQSSSEVVTLVATLLTEFQTELPPRSAQVETVVTRLAVEVERICTKSSRIQNSGDIENSRLLLARMRMQKYLSYYRTGSRQGRVELHSHLSTMVYRHILPHHQGQLGFSARYSAIEDFLQSFYIEVLKAFRRENGLPDDYCPKTRLELAEYMAFTELYAKRRIALPGQRTQQLLVLRAQGYAQRQPPEATIDLDLAVESAKGEDAELYSRSPLVQQVRDQMVAEATDPTDAVIRDRVIAELIAYLEEQGQSDCVDYLVLKLKDLSAPEIDDLLNLSSRQRDYLQQRFKYHVEKFSRSHRWQLVHQWLGADLDQNLGMPQQQWEAFLLQLSPDQQQLLQLKGKQMTDPDIAKVLKCTPKQVQKRWVRLLDLAWQMRNRDATVPSLDA